METIKPCFQNAYPADSDVQPVMSAPSSDLEFYNYV